MAWIDPSYEAERRRYWTRPDAYRFAPPGSPEAKMPGWLDPWMTRVRFKEAAEEAARAEAEGQEALEREILELRRDWEELKREIATRDAATRRAAEVARIKSDIAWDHFIRTFKRYAEQQKAGFNPDQPRDAHGKWTDAGGDKERAGDAPKPGLVSQPSAMRRGGPRMPATPTQQARLTIASARAREAVGRVQQLDPHWRPQSATSRDNRYDYEVMIRAKEAEINEAEVRFMALSRAGQDAPYPMRDAPTTAEVLAPGGDLRGYQVPGVGAKSGPFRRPSLKAFASN